LNLDYTLRLDGELDAVNSDKLAAALAAASQGTTRLVLDMSRVTFLDSAAGSALLQARAAIAANGGALVLRDLPDRIAHTLNLLGLRDLLECRA
jgi:anti-anti-sigma factor